MGIVNIATGIYLTYDIGDPVKGPTSERERVEGWGSRVDDLGHGALEGGRNTTFKCSEGLLGLKAQPYIYKAVLPVVLKHEMGCTKMNSDEIIGVT